MDYLRPMAPRSPASPPGRLRDGAEEPGAGYCRAVRAGAVIEVSGTTCRDPSATPDVYSQTLECLRRALAAVEELGGTVNDVVRTRLFLAPGADWRRAADAHGALLGAVAPANTTLHVAGLIGEGTLVEVELSAVCASESGR